MKKLLSLTLVLSMVLVMCMATPVLAEPETVSLKMYRAIFSSSPQGTVTEERWQAMMEDHLGVKLDITWEELPFSEFNSKMSVYMAAGDWADAFLVSNYSMDDTYEFGKQGLLVNLADYLDEDSYYMSYVNASVKNKNYAYASDGGIYAFLDGAVSEGDRGAQYTWGARFDTFKEHGMTVPTSMQEIYDAAVELKALYPDSYPVTIGYGDMEQWLKLYHSRISLYYDGEKYVYGPYRDADAQYKAIEYLNKLYNEELLDPEWQTDTSDQFFTKYLTGKNFISSAIWGSHYAERLNYNEEYDVEWGMINYPNTLEGEPGYRTSEHEIGKTLNKSYGIVINAASEHVELLVDMIDYQYSDEMVNLTNWGIEGETYTVDELGEKNYVDEIMNAANPPAKLAEYGVNQSMSCRSGMIFLPQLNDAGVKLQVPNPYYYNGEFGTMVHWAFYTVVRDDFDNVMPVEPARTSFDDLELEDLSVNKTALDTYVKEELVKFINGSRSLDTWQQYVDDMPNYGDIDLIEEIYNRHIVAQ
ncbi:MAG: hypothetical protein ACI4L8_09320 [Candidatus Fimadaptatus sp.]